MRRKVQVRVGHQRFADMMAWELFLLEEDDLAPFARQDAGDGTARGPPPITITS